MDRHGGANVAFVKMHGLGNDFVIIDGRENGFSPNFRMRIAIADRHRGIGCDVLVVLEAPTAAADVLMRIYNPDGSATGACGNVTRCVAQLLFRTTGRTRCVIQTEAGLLESWAAGDGRVAVDMGVPRVAWQEIPLSGPMDTLAVALSMDELPAPCCVGMGNPHAVFFVDDVAAVALAAVGPRLENHALFPERCNIEFVQILHRSHFRMRVWERGAGITQACGSGACATVVAAARRGLGERSAVVTLDGGDLYIEWRSDNHVVMSGPTALVFSGELVIASLEC